MAAYLQTSYYEDILQTSYYEDRNLADILVCGQTSDYEDTIITVLGHRVGEVVAYAKGRLGRVLLVFRRRFFTALIYDKQEELCAWHTRQRHTSAYISIRQHTSAYMPGTRDSVQAPLSHGPSKVPDCVGAVSGVLSLCTTTCFWHPYILEKAGKWPPRLALLSSA